MIIGENNLDDIILEGWKGSGKTEFMVWIGWKYYKLGFKIFSNFITDFSYYTPYFILPYSRIRRAVFLIDDVRHLDHASNIFTILVNQGRKDLVKMIFTGHHYSDFKPKLRKNAVYYYQLKRELSILNNIELVNAGKQQMYKTHQIFAIRKFVKNEYEMIDGDAEIFEIESEVCKMYNTKETPPDLFPELVERIVEEVIKMDRKVFPLVDVFTVAYGLIGNSLKRKKFLEEHGIFAKDIQLPFDLTVFEDLD